MTENKVFVSVPSNRNPEWGMIMSLTLALAMAGKAGIKATLQPLLGESLISRARIIEMATFLESDCTHLYSQDDDVEIPADTIIKLIEADKDIIGGAYRLKDPDEVRIAVRQLEEGPDVATALFHKEPIRVRYVSTGCMLVKRKVFEETIAMFPDLEYGRNLSKQRLYALYQPFICRDEYLSEDWALCERATTAGFKVWMHGGVQCRHYGRTIFEIDRGQ